MMTGRQIAITNIINKLEKATVGTFEPIWKEFCQLIGEDNPKNYEKYIDKEHGKKTKRV